MLGKGGFGKVYKVIKSFSLVISVEEILVIWLPSTNGDLM
jgi:hypothetical protein